MEELYAKFLPPFLEQARERLALARAAAAQPEGPELGPVRGPQSGPCLGTPTANRSRTPASCVLLIH